MRQKTFLFREHPHYMRLVKWSIKEIYEKKMRIVPAPGHFFIIISSLLLSCEKTERKQLQVSMYVHRYPAQYDL